MRKNCIYKLWDAGAGPSNSTRFFLTACAQFKDEDTILQEWLLHYIKEGVQHFYLIDDGSTDASHAILSPFISRGLVTLMVDDRKAHSPALSMVERYNLLFQPFFYSSSWMLHVDRPGNINSRILADSSPRGGMHQCALEALRVLWPY